MARDKGLTRSISTHVTPAEYDRIRQYAAERQMDVSTVTRDLWLQELGEEWLDIDRQASSILLQLFIQTMEASLELGDQFTGKHFRRLCADVKAQFSATSGNPQGETKEHAQA